MELENIVKQYYLEADVDPTVLFPYTQGNIQYLYIVIQNINSKTELQNIIQEKLKNFDKKTLSLEIHLTKQFLKKTLQILDEITDFNCFKKQIEQLIYLGMKGRIEFHKKLWDNPKINLVQTFEQMKPELKQHI